jgi:hypothetical protein
MFRRASLHGANFRFSGTRCHGDKFETGSHLQQRESNVGRQGGFVRAPAVTRLTTLGCGGAALLLAAFAVLVTGCGPFPPPPACAGTGQPLELQPSGEEQPISQTSPGVAALALRYEPTVEMSKLDRFWPVSLATVLRARDLSGKGVQLVSHGQPVASPATPADLSASDSSSAYLEYPARLADKAAQMRAFLRGVGVPEPQIDAWPTDLSKFVKRSAQIYFYDAGTGCKYAGRDTSHYRALQYWLFYGLNYYPMTVDTATMLEEPLHADTADIDFHEGDWEHITVLLEPQGSGYVPKFVWMARHSSEGRLFPWAGVEHDSTGHPVVYPAFGGHPSYPGCGAHARALLAAAVYDYVVCRPGLYKLKANETPLVDLAHVGWSCWPGYFGTTVGTTASGDADDPTGQILVAGPRSPLRQGENKHVCPRPSG